MIFVGPRRAKSDDVLIRDQDIELRLQAHEEARQLVSHRPRVVGTERRIRDHQVFPDLSEQVQANDRQNA